MQLFVVAVLEMPIQLPELRDFRRDPRFQDVMRELAFIEYRPERGPRDLWVRSAATPNPEQRPGPK